MSPLCLNQKERQWKLFPVAIDWASILLGLAISQGVNALTFIIIANKVPPAEYGQYLATHSLVSLSLVLPNAGLDTFLLSYNQSDHSSIYSIWRLSLLLRSGLLAFWFAIMRLGTAFLPRSAFPPDLMVFVYIGLATDALTQLSYSAMRNLKRHREVTKIQILVSSILMTLAFAWPSGAGQVIKFSMARSFLSITLALFIIFARMHAPKPFRISLGLITKNLAKEVLPFYIADIAMAIYLKADLTIVSLFQGTYGASVYGPALNIVNMLFLIPNALYLLAVPTLAQKYQSDRTSFSKISIVQMLTQFLTGITVATLLCIWSPALVKLLLPAYINTIPVLRLMSPVIALKALNFGAAAILTSAQLQPWRTTAQVITALFNVTANLIVIGSLGVQGVALVYTLSEFLLSIGYLWPVLNRLWSRQCVS